MRKLLLFIVCFLMSYQSYADVVILDCEFSAKENFLPKAGRHEITPPTKKLLYLNKKGKVLFNSQKVDCSNSDKCKFKESDEFIYFSYCRDGGCSTLFGGHSLSYELNKYTGNITFTIFNPAKDVYDTNMYMFKEEGNCKKISNKPKF